MVVVEVYTPDFAIIKKMTSFWAFLYIWGNDRRSLFRKTFFWGAAGGEEFISSCEYIELFGASRGAPLQRPCRIFSEFVGAGASCSVCRPPGASRKFGYQYREPQFCT